ncbi:hypothetical protein [Sedimentibacter sp.]|uniref:hypothetical protein n=1 Tax=Sedimentibacter sp. TaxID=1960295 RepID=UPI0028A15AF8|nr:hypothetical protein [Sedimentibacter sp.]
MFMNEMILLKRENEAQIKTLRDDDVQTIKYIMKSMSVFKVNSYDAQVIKRDLIGMAQEFELRNKTLHDAIGSDVKGFAHEIIKNSGGPCIYEIVLGFLLKMSGYFFGWFLVLAVGAYSGNFVWNADPIMILFYFIMVILSFITEGMINPVFSMEKGFKKEIGSIIPISLFLAVSIMFYFMYDKQNIREINAGYIVITSGISYLIVKYLNNKNINKLASNKKNFIQDLN